MSRLTARHDELAVRRALGASTGRIVRQMLTENIVLSGLGGAAGLLIAMFCLDAFASLIPAERGLSLLGEVRVDGTVLGVTLLMSLGMGVVLGLVPALRQREAAGGSGQGLGTRVAGPGAGRSGQLLVTTQVALTVVLLIGAGLAVRSFANARHVDLGFEPDGVLTMQIALPSMAEPDRLSRRAQFFNDLTQRLAALPGVSAAGVTQVLPMQSNWSNTLIVEGADALEPGTEPQAQWRCISAGYFETMCIPLMEGRVFNTFDDESNPPVAIVNELVVRQLFEGASPLGRHIRVGTGRGHSEPLEIVGVVGNVLHGEIGGEPGLAVYQPITQVNERSMQIAIRTEGDPMALAGVAQRTVWELDADQPVSNVMPMGQHMADEFWRWRFSSLLMGVFALLAGMLTLVGLYGVLGHHVSRRMREIGVRMALGATTSGVCRLVLLHGLKPVVIGLAIGLIGGAGLTRLMHVVLFELSPADLPGRERGVSRRGRARLLPAGATSGARGSDDHVAMRVMKAALAAPREASPLKIPRTCECVASRIQGSRRRSSSEGRSRTRCSARASADESNAGRTATTI
jgi:predicted permease